MGKSDYGLLDDANDIRKHSPEADMFEFISDIPNALRKSIKAIPSQKTDRSYNNIVYCGMGGSAIAGDISTAILGKWMSVPMTTVRDYSLPGFVNEKSLVIAISYSGDTEETLSCAADALSRGASIITISSGGKLAGIRDDNHLIHIDIPRGMPPRCALGYLLPAAMLGPLEAMDLQDIKAKVRECLLKTAEGLEDYIQDVLPESTSESNPAKMIARKIFGKIPVIYTSPPLAPAGYRWGTQLNENAKINAFSGVIPEMNHNHLVGWGQDDFPDYIVVIISRKDEEERIKRRVNFFTHLLEKKNYKFVLQTMNGTNEIEELLKAIILGDCVSLYLSVLRDVNPYPVKVISELKFKLLKG